MAAFTFSLPPSSSWALWWLSVVPSTGEVELQRAFAASTPPLSPLPSTCCTSSGSTALGQHVLGGFVPPGPEKSKRVCAGQAAELAAFTRTPRQNTEWCRLPSLLARQVLDLAVRQVLLLLLEFTFRYGHGA